MYSGQVQFPYPDKYLSNMLTEFQALRISLNRHHACTNYKKEKMG